MSFLLALSESTGKSDTSCMELGNSIVALTANLAESEMAIADNWNQQLAAQAQVCINDEHTKDGTETADNVKYQQIRAEADNANNKAQAPQQKCESWTGQNQTNIANFATRFGVVNTAGSTISSLLGSM